MDLQKIAYKNYQFTNWSRTFVCKPELYFVPHTYDEIREIIYLAKSERKRIRVVGCGASPSDICCSTDYMIDLSAFDRVLHINGATGQIIVQGGIKIYKLNSILERNNLAIPVLGSISDSTLAGVISVGTHGTGYATGIIADYVLELRLIVPSGDIVVCNRDTHSELFLSALCGLGALGIILEITFQCVEKFYLHQLTYPSTLNHVLDTLDELVESCDHFRFLWFPHTDFVSVSITNKINGQFLQLSDIDYHNRRRLSIQEPTPAGASATTIHNDPITITSTSLSSSLLQQQTLLSPSSTLQSSQSLLPFKLTSEKHWWQRVIDWVINYGIGYHVLQFAYWISTYIPAAVPYINRAAFWLLYSNNNVTIDISYKIFNFECLFDQYVNEWCIPRTQTANVLRALRDHIENSQQTTTPLYAHFPVEVRFSPSSDIYLAPTYGRDSTHINIICYRPYRALVPYQPYWNMYEYVVKQAGGRPHWAKAHRETQSDFVRMYPHFRLWMQVRRRYDPCLLFSNSYMDRIFETPIHQQQLDRAKVAELFTPKMTSIHGAGGGGLVAPQRKLSNETTDSNNSDSIGSSWSSILSTETAEVRVEPPPPPVPQPQSSSASTFEVKVEVEEKKEEKGQDDDNEKSSNDNNEKEKVDIETEKTTSDMSKQQQQQQQQQSSSSIAEAESVVTITKKQDQDQQHTSLASTGGDQ